MGVEGGEWPFDFSVNNIKKQNLVSQESSFIFTWKELFVYKLLKSKKEDEYSFTETGTENNR